MRRERHHEMRRRIFERDHWTCRYCGFEWPLAARRLPMDHVFHKVPPITTDHVIPASRGGKTVAGNLVTACGPCNHKRGNTGSATDLLLKRIDELTRHNEILEKGAARMRAGISRAMANSSDAAARNILNETLAGK